MPTPSRALRNQDRHIKRRGVTVTLNDKSYKVITQEEASAKTGAAFLTQSGYLGVVGNAIYLASADSRSFTFSPLDFQTYTSVPPPAITDLVYWHGRAYRLTNVTYQDEGGDDTILIIAFGLRVPHAESSE